jgi:hypothetical protein
MNPVRSSNLPLLLLVGLVPFAGCGDRDAVAPVKPEAITEPDVVAEEPVAPVEWREATSADGRYFVRWRPLAEPIPMADPFDVEVEIWTDETMSESGDYDSILVDAGMPHHGHGMNVRPEQERRADGSWVARGMLMHMPGRWQVYVDVFDDGRLERAQWSMWLSG